MSTHSSKVGRRPGPLKDLPLEQFLSGVSLTCSPFKSSHKRPHSPGGASLLSPAKRRILDEEGMFSPGKQMKSPLSASGSGRFAPSHFETLLRGPASPARKLDFGLREGETEGVASAETTMLSDMTDSQTTPIRRDKPSSISRLAPSPEFLSKKPISRPSHARPTFNDDYDDDEVTEFFGSPAQTPPSSLPSSMSYVPVMIPREMPPPHDPHSIHYPGFDIYQDTHIFLPRTSDVSSMELDLDMGREVSKENIPPRKKGKKAVTAPIELLLSKANPLLSPNAKIKEVEKLGRAKSIPASPRKRNQEMGLDDLSGGVQISVPEDSDQVTPVARRGGIPQNAGLLGTGLDAAMILGTPGRSPAMSREGRKERRRMLEQEADEAAGL